jgi:hypothetical protein
MESYGHMPLCVCVSLLPSSLAEGKLESGLHMGLKVRRGKKGIE